MLRLPAIENIKDQIVRDLFRLLRTEVKENPFLKGSFVLREYTFPQAVTNEKIPHGLGFLPKDIWVTSTTGAGTLTVNYDKTTTTQLDVSTTDACVVRLLIGRVD